MTERLTERERDDRKMTDRETKRERETETETTERDDRLTQRENKNKTKMFLLQTSDGAPWIHTFASSIS